MGPMMCNPHERRGFLAAPAGMPWGAARIALAGALWAGIALAAALWAGAAVADAPVFQDVTAAAGIAHVQHGGSTEDDEDWPFWQSGGAAVGDVDGDGWVDLYVTRPDAPDILYRNQGDGTFADVTVGSGLDVDLPTNGAGFADIDNDGDLDLYVTTIIHPRNYLFVNDGTGTFSEEGLARGAAVDTGIHHEGYSVSFGDFDRDGWIDIHMDEQRSAGGFCHARLLRNRGAAAPGHFDDVTAAAGVDFCAVQGLPPGPGIPEDETHVRAFASSFADLDDDGWLDLAVAADWRTSRLFWNQRDGTFVDGTDAAGVGTDENGMGSAIADWDGDGDLDWFVSAIFDSEGAFDGTGLPVGLAGNRFYRNEGSRRFSDATDLAAVRDGGWGWGALLLDHDNDGDPDLALANGQWHPDVPFTAPFADDPTRLWRNDGAGPMPEVAAASGLTDEAPGKGLLAFDYDRDGDLDLFLVVNGAAPILYRNDGGNANHWLRVRVQGPPGFNAGGVGARVYLQASDGGPVQVRQVGGTTSYLGQSERVAHFGLGAHAGPVHRVTVAWPGLGESVYEDVAADQVLVAATVQLVDGDGDGIVDAEETALGMDPASADADGDGVLDTFERGPGSAALDTDGDGTLDALDPDDDGDGVPTADEDANGNGYLLDDDADGDGIPDYLENDRDADGTDDGADNCPDVANADQSDVDGDGVGDLCQPGDADQDGWSDDADNCPVVPNPSQADQDQDGFGDACADSRSVARQWNEELLGAIRRDFARPTVHARNLFHVSAAIWDAWVSYSAVGDAVYYREAATAPDVEAARAETISYAAYRVLEARFADSPGADFSLLSFASRMGQLGYDPGFTSTLGSSPAALGNRIAQVILDAGLTDGANEAEGYANQYYEPVNPPLIIGLPGNPTLLDANRWQPLSLSFFVDQAGIPIPGGFPPFLSPEWGAVRPFSLAFEDVTIHQRDGFDYWVYHDPGPPSLLGTPSAEDYLDGFEMVALWSSHLDPADGVLWDISPGSQGNAPLPEPEEWRAYYGFEGGGDWGTGYATNPVTGEPYAPQIVPRADYGRVLAEFWADGPDSETPPGHWFTIANYVSDNLATKQIGGAGPEVSDLEWDVKLYLLLGGAMHDVAVSVWGMKGWYDYIRPVSALRAMAERGQRSDPGLPSYHPEGFELRPGFIELVTAASSAPGERHEHLAAHVGEVAIRAWRGPDFIADPDTDEAGVGWILAAEWWPYQRPSFVTPPFAGFPSGHSAYSRAAAVVLHEFTGSPWFPGGLGEFVAHQDEFLVFEDGPSQDITLQFASFYDASDQTSLSRIWGGIHPPVDDIVSRHIGATIGHDAVAHAFALFEPPPACSDGQDNDGDGLVDYPEDPGCMDADSVEEVAACQDGVDNDEDGLVDFDGGASLHGGVAVGDPDPECAGAPWRVIEDIQGCGLGAELVLVVPGLMWLRGRRRRGGA